MASLKDYLRNFAKAGSGFAFPSRKTVDLESFGASTGSGVRTYVAPANGYLTLFVNATASASAEAFSGYTCQQLSSNPSKEWARCFVPCRKGQECQYAVYGERFIQGKAMFVYSEGSL